MRKKLFLLVLAIITAFCCIFGLSACDDGNTGNNGDTGNTGNTGNNGNTGDEKDDDNKDNVDDKNSTDGTEGLSYKLSDDGTYYICSGIGKAADKEIVIASKYNGLPVTVIDYDAFEWCRNITSVTIPDGVTEIRSSAFHSCENLVSVTIPKSVTEIGEGAFLYCRVLKSVTIPDGVTQICADTFYQCESLTSVTLPDGVTEIGENAFYGCTGITNLKLGKGVKFIGNAAFANLNAITSVVIPDGVTQIGDNAFSGCGRLKNITLPASLIELGDFMFDGCMEFNSITYNGTKAQWESIFHCYWGTNMGEYIVHCTDGDIGEIYDGSKDVDENATVGLEYSRSINDQFYRCSGIGKAKGTDIVISSTYKGLPVTGIQYAAFSGCANIESVVIPDSVTEIGEQAFSNCSSLKSITLPDSVTVIDEYAFGGTGYYNDERNWSSGVLYIGNHLISARRENSGSYTVRQGTITIAARAFDGCNCISKIILPDGIKTIGDHAFYECSSLTSVNIPVSVTTLGDWAFYNCYNLKNIAIPDGITLIGGYTFYKCFNLEEVTIPASVIKIETNAFGECSKLTSIIFNGTKEQWENLDKWNRWDEETGDYVIHCTDGVYGEDKSNLTAELSYELSEDETYYICTGIGSVTEKQIIIPSVYNGLPVKEIDYAAFHECSGLTGVTIENGVSAIGVQAFWGCSNLESIIIPDSVTSIGSWAFTETAFYKDSKNYAEGCLYIGNHLIKANGLVVSVREGTLTIGDSAFFESRGLVSVIIPDSVKTIGAEAFYGCVGLKNITIPDSVTSIEFSAFKGCSGLAKIMIGSGVAKIGGGVGNVFIGCSAIESITVSLNNKDYKSVDNCLLTKDGTKLIAGCKNSIIPNGVKTIDNGAFADCSGLESITIPNSVTSIEFSAFIGCSGLETITIPDSVTSIDVMAFFGCSGLTSITYSGTKVQWDSVEKAYFWDEDTGEYVIHCTDGDIQKQ